MPLIHLPTPGGSYYAGSTNPEVYWVFDKGQYGFEIPDKNVNDHICTYAKELNGWVFRDPRGNRIVEFDFTANVLASGSKFKTGHHGFRCSGADFAWMPSWMWVRDNLLCISVDRMRENR